MRYEGKHLTMWDNRQPEWRSGCLWLALALIVGLAIGFIIGSCVAPRSASATTPTATSAQINDLRATARPTPESTVAPSVAPARTSPIHSVAPRSTPKPKPTATVVEGLATYYDDGPGLYAAVRSFQWGDRPYEVTVCIVPRPVPPYHECVNVTIRDHCYCIVNGERRLIDLSPAAFSKLAPLSVGKIHIEVRTR